MGVLVKLAGRSRDTPKVASGYLIGGSGEGEGTTARGGLLN